MLPRPLSGATLPPASGACASARRDHALTQGLLMITFLYILYVLVCLFLILVVLLQAGRGGMGAAFGGSSQTVFGGSGAGNFLTRLTVISAALFMMLSATLTYVSSSGEKSLENASERVRVREEARSAASKKDAKGGTAAPAAPQSAAPASTSSESSPGSTPAPSPSDEQPSDTKAPQDNPDEAPANR
jgi:preprotein translocase subunit SecG